jgi:hypothetical protein
MATQAPVGQFAVARDPGLDVVGREPGVGIVGRPRRDVDHHQRHDQLVHRDLVGGVLIGGEVDGRIHVGSGVLDEVPLVLVVAIVLERLQPLQFESGLTEKGRKVRPQRMGEVEGPGEAHRLGPRRRARRHDRGDARSHRRGRGPLEETAPAQALVYDLLATWNAHVILPRLSSASSPPAVGLQPR